MKPHGNDAKKDRMQMQSRHEHIGEKTQGNVEVVVDSSQVREKERKLLLQR